MNSYNRTKLAGGFSPALLLILGAILTAAIILGIKFLTGEDSNSSLPPAPGQEAIFKQAEGGGAAPAGLMPAARSESTSGGSLDIFQKANEGYSEEDSSSTAATQPAGQETVKKTPAATPAKKQASKKLKQRPAIPRLQGVKAFGTAAPAKQGMPKGGPGIPDMAEILKQAQEKQEDGD